MNRTILTVISSMVFSCQLVLAETGVKLGTLEEIANYPVRSAPATALSINDAEIAVEIAGRVAEVHVRVGDVREKGATLVSLDCGTYDFRLAAQRAKLGVSKARIGLAERRLARTKTLAAKQSVSDEILDERVSELEILKAERAEINANYTLAKQDVNRCTIVAAFPTLVTERIAAVGEYL
ncbi:MAG: biotin/lipoyl-binding protein, partial [Pseudomonadota bacterium]